MVEVMQKRSVKHRKFRSAPNLPVDESLIKGEDMFLVSQNDINSFKKRMTAKLEEEKKKTTQSSKKKKTKLNSKAVAKLLIEPIQTGDTTEQKQAEDYQWLIKKKIVKLMGSQKLKQQGKKYTVLNKTTNKPHKAENKPHIQQVLQLVKSPNVKDLKQSKKHTQGPKVQNPKRRNASAPLQRAIIPKQKEEAKERPASNIPTILRMTKPSLVEEEETASNASKPMERLKKIFSAFKPDPETVKSRAEKKLDVVFSKNETRREPKKSTTKNLKTVVPEHDATETINQMKALKETVKNKIRLGSAAPNRNKIEIEAPDPHKKVTQKKRRKATSQQKLVYTVTA